MNEKKTAVAISKSAKAKPTISADQLEEILFPELSADEFSFNEKKFAIRILPWKWDAIFRRHALPIITEELKPFERALQVFTTNSYIVLEDLGIAKSAGRSEIEGDNYLTNCIVTICMSQDPEMLKAAAEGRELDKETLLKLETRYRVMVDNYAAPDGRTRLYLREIVRKQAEKQKLVQTLGESLIARLGELSELTGTKSTFDSLKRDFTRLARSFMEKAGKAVETLDSSSSLSMASGFESRPLEKPSTRPNQDEAATEVLPTADLEEEQVERAKAAG
jgi:hypothetical protein